LKTTTVKGCIHGNYKHIIGVYEDGTIRYVKTDVIHPLHNIPKVVINGYTYPRYFYDKKGEYGKYPKDGTNFIIVGEKLDKIVDYFNTKLSALLLNYIKYTQKKIDPQYYPDIRDIPVDKITDSTLADYFGFTEKERAAIEAVQYPKREYTLTEVSCAELKKEGGAYNRNNVTRKIFSRHRNNNV
jgi:hypothetical protein